MSEDVGNLVVRVAMDNSSFKDGVANLNRSLKVIQSEFKGATSGLKEHGKGLDRLKAKQEMLSKSITVQSKLVQQYKAKLEESKNTLNKNAAAQTALKEKVQDAKKAYEESKSSLGKNNEKTKELKESYEKLSIEYEKGEEKLRSNIRAIDNWTVKTNNAQAKLKGMEQELSSTSKEIARQSSLWDKLSNKLNTIGKKFDVIGNKMESLGKGLTTKLTGSIAAIGVVASKVGMDFEASMSNVSALSGNTGDDLKKLEVAARDAGASTSKSAKDAADALGYMALAGYDNKEMMEALMPVLRLSEAGNLDLARTSDLVTDSLSALGKSTSDLPVYLDQVAKTAASSNTNIDALMEALITCGGTVKNLNTPLDEANTLLGVLANRGNKGSEAGNSFNSILINLTSGAGEAGKAMAELGLSAFDSEGNFKGVTKVLLELNDRTKHLTEEQRNMYLSMIGGKTQIKTLQALLSGVSEEYGELNGKIQNSTGSLNKMAKTMQDNNKGSITQLMSALEELGIKIYDILKPKIAAITEKLQEWTDKLNSLTPAQQENIIKIAGFAAAAGPLILIISKIVKLVGGAITAFSTVSGAIAVVTTGATAATPAIGALATAFTVLTGPIGLTIAAISAIGVAVYASLKHFDKLKEKFESLSTLGKVLTGIVVATNPALAAIAGITLAIKGIQTAMEPAVQSTKEFGDNISEGTQKALGAYEKLDNEVGQTLMNLRVKGDKISKDTANVISNNFSSMSNQITSKMKESFNKDYETINNFMLKSGALRNEESKKILSKMQENQNREINIVKQGEEKVKQIMATASAEKRQLNSEELHVINTIRENMMQSAIKSMSQSELEQRSLLERQRNNASAITAEQAAQVVKNSATQRDKVIQEAEKQYDQTVQTIIKQRDELGSITDEQAKKLISAAKHQKEQSVNQAQGLHQEVVMEAQNQAKEHVNEIDWETGEIKSKWDVMCSNVSEKATELKNKTVNSFNEKKQAVVNKCSEIKTDVVNKWNSIVTWFDTLPERLKQKAYAMFERMKQGIDEKIGTVRSAAENVGNKIVEAVKGIPSKMLSIGGDIVSGLANGIRNFAGSAWDAATELANGVADRVKSALDIHSPSRVMVEIGKFIDEGLGNGITDNVDTVKKATTKVANMIKDEISKVKGDLEKDINGYTTQLDKLKKSKYKGFQNLKYEERDKINAVKDKGIKETIRREYDAKERALKAEYELKEKNIKEQIKLRKKQANEEIKELERISKMSKEQLKEELKAKEKFVKQINDLSNTIIEALKEQYKKQQELNENALKKELDSLEQWKDESINRINSVYDYKLKRIDDELEALDKAEKEKARKEEELKDLDRINKIKTAIEFEHDEFNKKQLQEELNKAILERNKKLEKEELESKKENLKKEKETLEKRKQQELENINNIYNSEKLVYEKRMEELKKFYDEKTSEAFLQAEAEKLIMSNNQEDIIKLLHSYSKEYEMAGQSLGEKLVDGFAPQIQKIKDMISSINAEISAARDNALTLASQASNNISNINNTTNNKNVTYSVNMNSSGRSYGEKLRQQEILLRNLSFTT